MSHNGLETISKFTLTTFEQPAADTTTMHKQTATGPSNAWDSYHSVRAMHGILRATRRCVQLPNGVVDRCASISPRAFRRAAECGAHRRTRPRRHRPWACHRLCPNTDAAVSSWWRRGRSTTMASKRLLQDLVVIHVGRDPRSHLMGHRPHRSRGSFLKPFFARSVGLGQPRPPKPGFTQHGVRRLPFPLHRVQFVALVHQQRPQLLEQADRANQC